MNRPKPYLLAVIFALIFSGVYSVDETLFDLVIVLAAGLAGYVMRLLNFPFLPLVLGLVLGYLIEASYRRSLLLSGGDHVIFVQDPVSLGLLIAAGAFVIFSGIRDVRDSRRRMRAAEGALEERPS